MNEKLMRADVAALMIVQTVIIELLDTNQTGVKQVIAETIQSAITGLPDEISERSMKATLLIFHQMMARENPLDVLIH